MRIPAIRILMASVWTKRQLPSADWAARGCRVSSESGQRTGGPEDGAMRRKGCWLAACSHVLIALQGQGWKLS